MKVVITTKRDLKDPHLQLDIDLERDILYVTVKHTCTNCAGYGCRNASCDDTIRLTPEEVIPTLGEDARPILERALKQLLGEKVISKL